LWIIIIIGTELLALKTLATCACLLMVAFVSYFFCFLSNLNYKAVCVFQFRVGLFIEPFKKSSLSSLMGENRGSEMFY